MMLFTDTSFTCARDGLTIRGTRFSPENRLYEVPVIISHGFMADETSVRVYAQAFAGAGFEVFTFDFCGGGIRTRSDGKKTDMTVLTERADLEQVVAYAASVTGQEQAVLMGCSQGGFVSGLVSAHVPEKVKALIMLYPALCIPDDARCGHSFVSYDPVNIPEEIHIGEMTIGRGYVETAQKLDPYAILKEYPGPVLLSHGTGDTLVKVDYSIRMEKQYRPGQCQLMLHPGFAHGYKPEQDALVIPELLKYAKRYCNGYKKEI